MSQASESESACEASVATRWFLKFNQKHTENGGQGGVQDIVYFGELSPKIVRAQDTAVCISDIIVSKDRGKKQEKSHVTGTKLQNVLNT